jgi:dihydrofolate reductase
MSRRIVYIAASLDGFIARKNGDIDWLEMTLLTIITRSSLKMSKSL